jgi:hypothetical protein
MSVCLVSSAAAPFVVSLGCKLALVICISKLKTVTPAGGLSCTLIVMGTSAEVDGEVKSEPGPPQEIRQKTARKRRDEEASLDMELLSESSRRIRMY